MKILDLKRGLAKLLIACGLMLPSWAMAAPLNTNLVVNPSFEDVDDFEPGPFTSVLILDWEDFNDDFEDAFAYPYSSDYSGVPAPPNSGDYHYTGGFNTLPDEPQIFQLIDVGSGPSGNLIATGNAFYNLGAFFTTFRTQDDASRVRARFLDANLDELGFADVGGLDFVASIPVNGDRKDWAKSEGTGAIPIGTDTIELQIVADDTDANHDGYVDLIDFQVTDRLRISALDIQINRETGGILLSNRTGDSVNLTDYSIGSDVQALNPDQWLSIADDYDADSGGAVDAVNVWSKLSSAKDLLNEMGAGAGATLANGQSIDLGQGVWTASPIEDLVFEYTLGGEQVTGLVVYDGNDGKAFQLGDFDTDGDVDGQDWAMFRDGQHRDLDGLSTLEAYFSGDLDGDFKNNFSDFLAFQMIYDQANGPGALNALIAIPECSSFALLIWGGGLLWLVGGRYRSSPSLWEGRAQRGEG